MSILINGMEMPTGKNNTLIFAIRSDGMVEDVMGCYIGKAVPVPPHGRLIDADEMARKDNDDFLEIMEMSAPSTVFATALADAHTAIQEMLKNAPTIIPAREEGE